MIPRLLSGEPNGFSIRRLKDKLGTRGMASAEIDFDGALAWPVGAVADGFKTAAGIVLNTSRWMTALGDAGMMRRAVLEARVPMPATARRSASRSKPFRPSPAVWTWRPVEIGALHLCFEVTRA